MGDGLVERMNRSILSLLRSYVHREGDWEDHLQLLLFVYWTTKHATTGLSPYEVLFGHNPPSLHVPSLPGVVNPEPSEYSTNVMSKLLQLRELVDANIVESAERQCQFYQSSETCAKLKVGHKVILNNPTKRELDPRWTGPWTVVDVKGPLSVVLRMGMVECTVHINRVRPLQRTVQAQKLRLPAPPPLFHHEDNPNLNPSENLSEEQSSCTADEDASSTSKNSQELQEGDATEQRAVPLASPGKTLCMSIRSG